jgi:DNA repair exonuclease SbcCD nuclease subunit
MAFRFVHAADIHLDSSLRLLGLRNSELAELVGDASRQAFAGVVDSMLSVWQAGEPRRHGALQSICLAERVGALLIAGDLYDGDQTSMKTARFLAAQIARLHQAGVRVYMIRGTTTPCRGSRSSSCCRIRRQL